MLMVENTYRDTHVGNLRLERHGAVSAGPSWFWKWPTAIYITAMNGTPGDATAPAKGKGGQERPVMLTRNSWQPQRGKRKKKKNHPKKPRKEDFAKWHHFILIRQRLKGWGEVWKQRHLGVRQKGGRSGQRLRKTTTRDPDGNTPAGRCKEAGQGGWQEWRPHRGHVLPLSWPAVSQKRSNAPGRTDNADRDLTKKMSCPQRNRGICRSRRQKVKELT